MCKKVYNKYLLPAFVLLMPALSSAQNAAPKSESSFFLNPLFLSLSAIIILLLMVIVVAAKIFGNLANSNYFEDVKKDDEKKTSSSTIISSIVILSLVGNQVLAQDKGPNTGDWTIGGLQPMIVYFMMTIILVEGFILASMIRSLNTLIYRRKLQEMKASAIKEKSLLDRLSDAVEVENEESIMLDHDYDGIHELDNNLPPWWKYGFYISIIWSVIYIYYYHVSKSGNLSKAAYYAEMKQAETDVAEYLKKSANNVDESSVKLLTDAAELKKGQEAFIEKCAACHGKLGEGSVGPNLTDEYWLHGGSIQDIFKTIKYGYPDKGMKSWKEEVSPMQIAQIASFIKTLKGTNPPNGKEKQGELYTEAGAAPVSDSTAVKADSTAIKADTLKK